MVVTPSELSRSLMKRRCPVCGSGDASRVIFEAEIDERRLDRMSYASRKLPEFMSLRLVQCPTCDLLYAPETPSPEFLRSAYRSAGFDSGEEAGFAARTYARELRRVLPLLPDRSCALEVGAGNGAYLAHLKAAGFDEVVGVEPSSEAAAAAAADVRPLLRVETFDASRHRAASFSLVVAFQTLEHIADPLGFFADAHSLLKPGGVLMTVAHNYRHWLMRLLGRRSPIVDIEHLQLFSPHSLRFALARAGFREPQVRPLRNTYPLHYWFKLLPLPARPKATLLSLLHEGAGRLLGQAEIGLSAGNVVAWARKQP